MAHSEDKINITSREKQILGLIAREYNTVEISGMLRISTRTVETHRKNILRKTEAKSLVGLTKHAIKLGLVDEYWFRPDSIQDITKEKKTQNKKVDGYIF